MAHHVLRIFTFSDGGGPLAHPTDDNRDRSIILAQRRRDDS